MGFEPTTPGITIRCSNQLSYTHQSCLLETNIHRIGAPGRNRTCNRRLRRPVLYPVELRALTADCRIEPTRPEGRVGMVGVEGFEPPTSCSQSRRATRLRYTPPTEPDCCFGGFRDAPAQRKAAYCPAAGLQCQRKPPQATSRVARRACVRRYNVRARKWRNW